MFQNLEVLFANNNLYSLEELESINLLALKHGLRGINVFGYHLEYFHQIECVSDLYLNIDLPYSRNIPQVLVEMTKYYDKEYGHLIKGFNFGLPVNTLDMEYLELSKYLMTLNQTTNKPKRLFVDYALISDHDEMFSITNLCINHNIDKIILGTSDKRIKSKFIIEVSKIINKLTNYKFGLFAFDIDPLEVGKLSENFNPIVLPPKNIASLLK